jgi:NRPS condensation-like uncharacterized protein
MNAIKNYTNKPENFWLRLDNAAKIYPAIKDKELTSVFRICAITLERIKIKQLFEAVKAIESRFPYYKVKLKSGFFWYYLEHQESPIPIKVDEGRPCKSFEKDELMFRILVRENKISVEFSHILTDGTGAFEFLKILLHIYFDKCKSRIENESKFDSLPKTPNPEEYEDAYKKYFKKLKIPNIKIPQAFHLPFGLRNKPRFEVLTAAMPIELIKNKSKEYGVSITEYLTAVYLYALQQVYRQQSLLKKRISSKIIRIEVPINLRRLYPSRTMRNFSLYVLPTIDLRLGAYTFEEIIKIVFHQMRLETDKKLINKMISRNVGGERNPILRRIPLLIKSLFLSKLYTIGTKQYSGVVTNLGKIDLGLGLNQQIKGLLFIPPPPNKVLKVNCGVAGFGNHLIASFGNITTSRELERLFFTFMVKEGVQVKIIS